MYGQIGVSKRRETHEKLRWCPETGLVFSIHPSPVDDSTSLAIHGAGTRNPRTVSLTYRKTCSPACSHTRYPSTVSLTYRKTCSPACSHTRYPSTVSLTYRKTCSPACSHTHCRHTEPQNRVTHVPENLLSGLSFSSKIFIFSCGVFVLCASIISSASLDLTEVEASFITTKITGHHRHHEYCYPLLDITDTMNIATLSWTSQTTRILLASPGHHRHHEYCYPLLDITDTTNIATLSWISQTPWILLPSPGHHRYHEYCYPLLDITDTTNIATLPWTLTLDRMQNYPAAFWQVSNG